MTERTDLFDPASEFPNRPARDRYERLVGLDDVKRRLEKEARLLLNPELLDEWSKRTHGGVLPIVGQFHERNPLFVFAGDVGTGKTELAETFGDAVARTEEIKVTLMRLSLNARGTGRVGEMTSLIADAFQAVVERLEKQRGATRASSAVILLIDEADALAQSRELAQMHHEDRAGVNALIRGVSRLANEKLPAIVVLCTNRLSALDPAVQRRAAAIFTFERPSPEQRSVVLARAFEGSGLTEDELRRLVELTGPNGRSYGYTYSDLTTRLIPDAVLDAFPDEPIRAQRVEELIVSTPPTPPFADETRD
jgi:AAA+ superfamily predicted ATPase